VPRVKYAMDYRPKNSFSMSYASRKVVFPGGGHLLKTIRSLRGRQMLVVRRDRGPDAGAPLPPLQPVERPAESTLESGGEGNGMESGQMPTRADL